MATLGKRKEREETVEEPKSHGSTLFISNLPYTATSTDINTLFSDIAPVRNAFVVLEHGSGASKGVGYVSFAIKEDAEIALTKISSEGLTIDGRSIRAQWAQSKPKDGDTSTQESKPRPMPKQTVISHKPKDPLAIRTVVLSGLSSSVDAKSLWKKIKKYEGAEKVDWPLKSDDGEEDATSAHALFSSARLAGDAVQKLHAHVFKGTMISATLKKRLDGLQKSVIASKSPSSSKPKSLAPSRANRLIVRNLPFDINEQDIKAAFLPHGPIHSIDIPRSESGKAQGFAFVWMLSRSDAEKALLKCNGMKIRAGMAEELAHMKQMKKKQLREQKKGRVGGEEEAGEDVKGAERVVAVDWALSKDKWEQEKAKVDATEDVDMVEDQAKEDDSGDDSEAIGVNEGEDGSDSELSDDSEGDDPKPGRPELPPPESGTTLFVRNLPFEATDDELRVLFRLFGPLRYARITMDANTGRSRGTGFVCFWNKEDADKAVERSEILRLETTGTSGAVAQKPNPFKLPSLLTPDPSSSLAQSLVLHGRTLDVVQAVTRNEATKLKEEGEKRREKEDKRNIYLLREGVILPNTEAAKTVPPVELEKRTQSFNTRRALLKSNPSLYVSRTRLSIRQLPLGVTEHMLKRLANYAIREFEEEVKKKDRMPLDPDELQDHSDETKPAKKRRFSGKVKQTKIIRQQDKTDPITGKGKSKGYGFLELHEHADALRVLRWANNNTNLAGLWAKWWQNEAAELINREQGSVKGGDKDGDKDASNAHIKRLKEELEKDGSGRWTVKGSLIVEFSIENIQVTQRRKSRESGTGHIDRPRESTKAEEGDKQPRKKLKLQDNRAHLQEGVVKKSSPDVPTQSNDLGSLIGRKRKQKKARS